MKAKIGTTKTVGHSRGAQPKHVALALAGATMALTYLSNATAQNQQGPGAGPTPTNGAAIPVINGPPLPTGLGPINTPQNLVPTAPFNGPPMPIPTGVQPQWAPDPVNPCPGGFPVPSSPNNFEYYGGCGGGGNDCAGATDYHTSTCQGTTKVTQNFHSCFTHPFCRAHDECYRQVDLQNPGNVCDDSAGAPTLGYRACDAISAAGLGGVDVLISRYVNYLACLDAVGNACDPTPYDGVIVYDTGVVSTPNDPMCTVPNLDRFCDEYNVLVANAPPGSVTKEGSCANACNFDTQRITPASEACMVQCMNLDCEAQAVE